MTNKHEQRKWNETRSFLKLQKEWYKKLKDDGFEDIEWTCHKTGKVSGYFTSNTNSHSVIPYIYDYYSTAQHLSRSKVLDSSVSFWEACVYTMHAQGEPERAIARRLNTYRDKVRAIIVPFRTDICGHATETPGVGGPPLA